ncbi:peptide ABC transporter substrate-binding protein [Marinicella pacifica]|uniref:Peptide ABC transporter substrate-binding protein n=1 Tax=Marinicella pacifica TaxID=1171543 RepID=A0A917CGW1_9GAMM|nr:peptide ABC transporter substrate-binding protein [Marinicella pacifica]GGF88445.1 peptide ABC transporter substrate-binding protein [Marinicella pacifica]
MIPNLTHKTTSFMDIYITCLRYLILMTISWQCVADSSLINRGNGAEPDSLNPHRAQGLNSHHILLDVYEGLFTYDINGEPVLGVAEHVEVSENGLNWEITLKDQARWSDGEPVVAADFIHAWQQAVAPETASAYAFLFDNLRHQGTLQVSSASPKKITIQLNRADPGFAAKLVLPVFAPSARHRSEGAVYNGAYLIAEHLPHERLELHKNPHFHAAQSVQVGRVNYVVTENQNSELLKFRAAELDITETIPDSQLDWLRAHYPEALRIAPYNGSFFLGLNLADKHLKDIALRKALNAAIDRDILVEKVLKSGQKPAFGLIPSEDNTGNGFDPVKARHYLAQSNFNTQSDRLQLLYNNSNNQKKTALAVAAMWRQFLGVKTQLKNQEWKVFIKTRQGPNKQVFRGGWIADYNDPLNYLQLFESTSRFNYYHFNNKAYDRLVEQIRTTTAADKRKPLIQQAEAVLQSEYPMIPLYFYVSRHLVNPDLKGYVDNLSDQHLSRYLHF